MLKIFTDVVTRTHYNADGNLFATSMPQMFFGGTETVYWQLCQNVFDLDSATQTPDADWDKYTGLADMTGIGAFLTADNNYTHKLKGALAVAIAAGPLATVTATITGASRSLIDTTGVVSLIDSAGEIEEVEYTSRTINGSTVVFTISTGTTVTGTYPQASEMDVNEAVYMQASMDVANSDPATGLFVFTIRAVSEKLRNEIVYSDVQSVSIKGLELAVFQVNSVDSTIEDISRYVLGSFSVMSGIADTRLNPVVSTARENAVLAYIQTVIASGVEHEYSIDGLTLWHETRADGDLYIRYRNVLAAGDWSPAVKLPDPVTVYDFWLSLGNTGSESDYLEAITGPQGPSGANGTNGTNGINGTNGTNGINGTNGTNGTNGISTYTKVAWASDNAGADFSLTPSDLLRYRAEIHVTEDIATPTLSDFTANGAVWVLALAAETIPDASTTVKGIVQFANSTQMAAGTATDLVFSPADLEAKLAGYVETVLLAQPSGVATLDGSGKLLSEQLPEISAGPDISTAIPLALSSSGLAGTSIEAAAADHVHPNTGLVLASEKGTANGVATLDGSGKVPSAQLPENTGYVSLGEDGYIPSEQLPPKTFIEILTAMPTVSASDIGRGAIYFGTGGGYTTNHLYKVAEATGTGVSSTSNLLVSDGGGEINGSINGNYTYSSGTGYARKWYRDAGSSKIFEIWHANDHWYIHSYEDDGEDGIMHFDEARGSGTDPHLASWETAWDNGFGSTDGNTGSIPSVNQISTEYTYYTWTDITPGV